MSSGSKINLLPKNEFENSVLGKFVQWAVSVGRWVVVFTELIVICAFISRFYFDTELANLFDSIRQNKTIVNSASGFEETFRRTQEKTKILKTVLAKQSNVTTILTEVSQLLPLDMTLTEFTLDSTEIKIKGRSLSERSIEVLLSGLGKNPKFKQIVLSEVSRKEAMGEISFSISIRTNQ